MKFDYSEIIKTIIENKHISFEHVTSTGHEKLIFKGPLNSFNKLCNKISQEIIEQYKITITHSIGVKAFRLDPKNLATRTVLRNKVQHWPKSILDTTIRLHFLWQANTKLLFQMGVIFAKDNQGQRVLYIIFTKLSEKSYLKDVHLALQEYIEHLVDTFKIKAIYFKDKTFYLNQKVIGDQS